MGGTAPVTAPVDNSKEDVAEHILRIIYSTPNITKEDIAKLLGISKSGVRYYIDKLKKEGRLEWQGNSRTGKWVIKY